MFNSAKNVTDAAQKKTDQEKADKAAKDRLQEEQATLKIIAHRKSTVAFDFDWSSFKHPVVGSLPGVAKLVEAFPCDRDLVLS